MIQPYAAPGWLSHGIIDKNALPFRLPALMISDTHFLHRKIAEYEPIRQTLGVDHNRVMIDRWQNTVADDDVIVHLGDLALGPKDEFAWIAEQLPGRKFLINTGNHDSRSRAWYAEHGFTLIPEFEIEHRDWTIRFTHYPDDDRRFVCYPHRLNVHGHVHSRTRDDRRLINLSVEAINFTPVDVLDVLDARIEELENDDG